MTKTASEHASVPTTFNRHIGWIRIPFVVLRLGFIVIYINKSAENVLVRFTHRERIDPKILIGLDIHGSDYAGSRALSRWQPAPSRRPGGGKMSP